ncbi:MAG TPA: DUF6311 domain-containing protein [Patescibacteria group bacterium]|nr:DUF6311 domain-containing protein [Patescibacteria group bacterium]
MKTQRYSFLLIGIALFLAVLIVYHLKFSLSFIWPTNTNLLFRGDWAQHYLSWEMFRLLPWQVPLGTLTNYFYPVVTNIGYTDTIPLFAFFFKLFSPLLPSDFQYIGLWFLLCFVLQAFFGVLIMRALKITNPIGMFAGAMLFTLSPVLLFRSGHPALCAQWLIVGSLWVYVNDFTQQHPTRPKIIQLILLLLSGFIHPYLAIIVFSFTLAYFFRLWAIEKKMHLLYFIAWTSCATCILLSSWYIIGYFSLPSQDAWGTGGSFVLYSTNLLAFMNPFKYSPFLPDIPLPLNTQFEGFAYLGLGILLFIPIIGIKKIVDSITHKRYYNTLHTKKDWRIWIPLIIIAAAFTIFSLSNVVNFGSHVLFTYPLPEKFIPLTNTFRACGRFIWVLYYCIVVFLFAALSRSHFSQKGVAIILMMTLIIQIVDISKLIYNGHTVPTAKPYQSTLSAPWGDVVKNRHLIVMYPPFRQDYVHPGDYTKFVYLAHQHNLAITTGYLARYNSKAYANYLSEIEYALQNGQPNQKALYITTQNQQEKFTPWLNKHLVSKQLLDGYIIFLPISSQ